jgi:plasmid stabilization system protein ParE
MRSVRLSITFNDQLNELLDYGEPRFGAAVTEKKSNTVYDTIERYLAVHPELRQPDPVLGLRRYPVSRTPFVLLYDFDEAEVRVHFIVHASADFDAIDPNSAEWD